MRTWIHPGMVIVLGALLIPWIRSRRFRLTYLLLLPIAGIGLLLWSSWGDNGAIPDWPEALHRGRMDFLDYTIEWGRIDRVATVFAYVFLIAGFCMNLYAFGARNNWEHVAAMVYLGSALGAVFAGDLFTLFFWLEIMSWAPVFLIWFRGTRSAMGAALRYALWHHFSGACILAGILLHVHQTGSIELGRLPWGWGGEHLGSNLMLLGFLVNAATPPFHCWLSDTYSEATPSGSVYLTAFTTKTAIYCLLRTFPGLELLIWLGALQAILALFLALLENDGRRLCSYDIISQVGYMVVGVGIGTNLAINGAISHALCHILYNSLLFMGVGSVLAAAGTAKFHELGGLYRYMPLPFWLYLVGGLSISGVPLFNGFISKTMTIEAAELIHNVPVYLLLEGATIGTFLTTGLRLPWNIWFQGKQDAPAPIRARLGTAALTTPIYMILSMAILALLCLLIGVYPKVLYVWLPYPVEFIPFTPARVFSITQMLLFTFLGFWVLRGHLVGRPCLTLDTDWPFRILGRKLIRLCQGPLMNFASYVDRMVMVGVRWVVWVSRNPLAALEIGGKELLLKAQKALSLPLAKGLSYQAIEERKRQYPASAILFPLGAAIGTILLFFVLYLAFYLFAPP
ncbi:MAG: Na(+)/H(+) antiporter subunit D [Desulfobacterota bacterium]|nr:Na(+)/H(+) antiporter subunit D [Thermodesulfobacteriota bacterium]